MLTKKDFEALAKQIRGQVERCTVDEHTTDSEQHARDLGFRAGVLAMVNEMVRFCSMQNGNFRTKQFVETCGLTCTPNGDIVFK